MDKQTTHSPPAAAIGTGSVRFNLNGRSLELEVEYWTTLLDLVRDRLEMTGTKKGCDHGQCGACTVLIDGVRVNACLVLAIGIDGSSITTIEGLAEQNAPAGDPQALHPLQQAFIDCDALQCGYCTPGQICSAAGLMNEPAPVNRSEIRERMSGNLCRCGAYPQIIDAVCRVILPTDLRPPSARRKAVAAMVASPRETGEIRT